VFSDFRDGLIGEDRTFSAGTRPSKPWAIGIGAYGGERLVWGAEPTGWFSSRRHSSDRDNLIWHASREGECLRG